MNYKGGCGGKRGRRDEVTLNGSSRPMRMRDHQLEYFGFKVVMRGANPRQSPKKQGVQWNIVART